MRILIIGGTRYIGPWVVKELVSGGHNVAVFHRGKSQVDLPPGVGQFLGDRKQLHEYREKIRAFSPQVVLDMIPYTEQDALTLVDVFMGFAERVVAVSSMDVYRAYGRLIGTEPGSPDPAPLIEESPLREKPYPYRGEQARAQDDSRRWMDDYDKILVERLIMSQPELPCTILRLPAVYGPRDEQHRLFPYLKRMDDKRLVIYLGEGLAGWRWTRGYVEDVAAGIAGAVASDRSTGQIYNVGESEALTEMEWVQAIGKAAGWEGVVAVVPDNQLPVHLKFGGDTRQSLTASTEKIRRDLGYRERYNRQEALRRAVEWERANPPETVDPIAFDYEAEDAIGSPPA